MFGYIFETTNTKTGKVYHGKRYAVKFDKKFFGDSEDIKADIEKYGADAFTVKMIMPYDEQRALDDAFAFYTKAEKKVEEPKVEEVKPKATRKKKQV